jgi:acyl-CoA thioesterase
MAEHHPHAGTQSLDPQGVAEAVHQRMFKDDAASQGLGMQVEAVAPGYARIAMTVRPDMLNGFRICHGGFIATLADSAFGYGCNSYNEMTVASGIVVDFLSPAHEGDRLVAECHELSRAGRTGVYDIKVTNQHGKTVVVMRGRSHTLKGKPIVKL